MPRRKSWTSKEEGILRNINDSGGSLYDAVDAIGRTHSACYAKSKSMGLDFRGKRRRNEWPEKDLRTLKKWGPKKTAKEMPVIFKTNPKTIRSKASSLNIRLKYQHSAKREHIRMPTQDNIGWRARVMKNLIRELHECGIVNLTSEDGHLEEFDRRCNEMLNRGLAC